ncbi:MAG TPA: ABC transporter substrate-binding protein [Iamia sp.]|nr:ABC transporter substrate-binding protein [Iamia sp.]
MHTSTFRRRAAVTLAVTLLLVGCGTSEKDSSGGSGSGSGSGGSDSDGDVRGVTDDEIVIGGIAPLTSASGGYPGAEIGAQARFARVNEEGGIHGRTIDYLGTEDDTEDGTKNLDLAHEMVQDQGAFAIVPMLGAGFLPATSDFLDEEQVPSVGWGFMPGQCGAEDSYGFGFNGCIQPPGGALANTSLAAQIVEELGGEGITVAIVSDDTANSTEGLKTVEGAFLAEGADVVYAKPNVPTSEQVDYTPFVQDVMTSDDGGPPDLVVFNSLFANTVGITAGLRGAGFEGDTLNYIAYVPGLLEQSPDVAAALDGSYVSTQFLPTEFGGEAIEQMEADFAAIDPDAQITLGGALTYWMADVFVQMLDAVGEDLTPATFGEIVNDGFTYEPVGDPSGLGPIEYPQGHGEPAPCSALVKIDGTSYEPVSPLTCAENVPLEDIEGA